MKMFHIDEFKCTLCANWFCPPFNLPYLLPCTHSVCTHCLQKSSDSGQIICPQDLQVNSIHNINVNLTTKKALERLMKEHKSYNQNTQLQCIKALSVGFDQIINAKEKPIQNLKALIDQIFLTQIDRIRSIHEKVKLQLTRPFKIVDDWKEIVSIYLTSLRKNPQFLESVNLTQLNHYIQQGRKIKLQLNDFFTIDLEKYAEKIISSPTSCFSKDFSFTQSSQPLKVVKPEKCQLRKTMSQFRKRERDQNHFILKTENCVGQEEEEKVVDLPRMIESKLKISDIKSKKNKGEQTKSSSNPLQSLCINSMCSSSVPTTREITGNLTKYFANINHEEEGNNFKQYIREGTLKNQSKSVSRNSSLGKSRNQEREMNLSQFQLDYSEMPKFYRTVDEPENEKNSLFSSTSYRERNSLGEKKTLLNNDGSKPTRFLKKEQNKDFTPTQYPKKQCNFLSPGIIREQYTEQAEQEDHTNENEEMLLTSERDNWSLGNMNFLKEWEISKKRVQEQELQVRQKGFYNCEKQKLSYMKRMQILRVQQVLKETVVKDNYIELINQSLHDVDIALYLSNFNWNEIEIIKFVRTSLSDEQLNIIMNYLMKSKVKALVLSNNNLTDISLDAFLHFVNVNNILKNVYLPKNYINILKSKQKINLLKEKGINIYI